VPVGINLVDTLLFGLEADGLRNVGFNFRVLGIGERSELEVDPRKPFELFGRNLERTVDGSVSEPGLDQVLSLEVFRVPGAGVDANVFDDLRRVIGERDQDIGGGACPFDLVTLRRSVDGRLGTFERYEIGLLTGLASLVFARLGYVLWPVARDS
jgi:hypothetical protein